MSSSRVVLLLLLVSCVAVDGGMITTLNGTLHDQLDSIKHIVSGPTAVLKCTEDENAQLAQALSNLTTSLGSRLMTVSISTVETTSEGIQSDIDAFEAAMTNETTCLSDTARNTAVNALGAVQSDIVHSLKSVIF